MRRVFLDNVENYPKSEVMVRMLRPAVGDSLLPRKATAGAGNDEPSGGVGRLIDRPHTSGGEPLGQLVATGKLRALVGQLRRCGVCGGHEAPDDMHAPVQRANLE